MKSKWMIITVSIVILIIAIISAGLFFNNKTVTLLGTAECTKLMTGDCQSPEVKKICAERCYTIENLDKVISLSPGIKVKVTGTTREEIFQCRTPPCAAVDGTKLWFISIDEIETLP